MIKLNLYSQTSQVLTHHDTQRVMESVVVILSMIIARETECHWELEIPESEIIRFIYLNYKMCADVHRHLRSFVMHRINRCGLICKNEVLW